MTFYEEMQNLTRDLLSDKDFKQGTIEYVRLVPGSGPIDNPGPSTPDKTELPGGVVKGVSFKYVNDGLALSTDLTVTVPVHPDITPDMRDFIDIDGVRHKIVQDISSPAGGTRVVWKFIVRKGS
jgi:hypothetical protein